MNAPPVDAEARPTSDADVDGGDAPVEVLVLGPAYCDLVFEGLADMPAFGTERFANGFRATAGGSAITAIALGRLGRGVALVADVGDDALGRVVREVLEREGVATAWLRDRAGVPTPATAVLTTPTDRAFVTYLPPDAPPADLAAILPATGARHLHVAGFPAAIADPDLVETARAHGVSVSFDPGWDEAALRNGRVRRLAEACDVLMPNLVEALLLADMDEEPDASEPGAATRALDRLAAGRADRTTVVKNGSSGAVGSDGAGRASASSPPIDAVDPTGAGDVFDAGFLDAWLRGDRLEACLQQAVLGGARAVTAYGGASAAPTRSELAAALARLREGGRPW